MSAARPGDDGRFLELAQSLRLEVRRFTDGLDPSEDGRSAAESQGREAELRVAIEELRAQNDTLLEACSRLERETAKYRDLYDGAPDALVTTDARGVIVDANPTTATLLAFSHDLLPGKLLIAFVARRDTMAFRGGLRAIVEGPGHGTISVRLRPRGGAPFLAHLALRAVHGPVRAIRGRREPPVALHWTIRVDAGEQRHEGDVYDLLETAAEELRAPVTATLGWSRLLHDGALHEQERAHAFAALAESALLEKELLDQVAELVALTRESEPAVAVSLAEVVDLAVDRARPAAALRSVLLTIGRADAAHVRTRVRADHLTWAFDRLLARAVQAASSPGTVHVGVSVRELHPTVHVRVPGAPALGGSRLAVAVARAAIERQGGALRVPELADDGVVLEVRLPLASS